MTSIPRSMKLRQFFRQLFRKTDPSLRGFICEDIAPQNAVRFLDTWKCFCHYRRMDTKKVNNTYCRYKIKTVTNNSFRTKQSPAVHSTLPLTVQLLAFYFVPEDNDVTQIIILWEWEENRRLNNSKALRGLLKQHMSRDRSVGTATGYGAGRPGSISDRGKIYLFSTASRPAVGHARPPIKYILDAPS
jgi:hypothetical protein